jgi:hypothetical protein
MKTNEQRCELCGSRVRVVGATTKHYEPVEGRSNEVVAREIVDLAIKDHDDGGYAYAGMNEILINRIAAALDAKDAEAVHVLPSEEAEAFIDGLPCTGPSGCHDTPAGFFQCVGHRNAYQTLAWLRTRVKDRSEDVKGLLAALEWYANRNSWVVNYGLGRPHRDTVTLDPAKLSEAEKDAGKRARAALAKWEGRK